MSISIMIATKDRPQFLRRALKYYHLSSFDGEIFIGDSSSESNSKEILKLINEFEKEIKIFYYKNAELSADQMISYLAKQVNFEYSVMMNDDDILIVSSIKKCVNFLQDHPDYVAVNGRAYNIGIDFNSYKPYGYITYINKYPLLVSENDKPYNRICDFFDNTLNLNMSITRSKINSLAFYNLMKINKFDSSFVFGELIQASTVLANGKIASINECYLVRQKHTDQYYRLVNVNDWLKKTDIVKSILELRRIIKNELLKKSISLDDKSKETIDILISSKINYILNRMIKKNNTFKILIKKIFGKLAKLINLIQMLLNSFYNKSIVNDKVIYENDKEILKLYFNLITKKNNI